MRQQLIELPGEIDKSTIIVAGFNSPLSEMNISSRQKISKDIVKLNGTMNWLDVIDIDRLFHLATVEYTFVEAHMEH